MSRTDAERVLAAVSQSAVFSLSLFDSSCSDTYSKSEVVCMCFPVDSMYALLLFLKTNETLKLVCLVQRLVTEHSMEAFQLGLNLVHMSHLKSKAGHHSDTGSVVDAKFLIS